MVAVVPAVAHNATNYGYDARGRLVTANHGTSGPDAGVNASYTYDAANNRAYLTVTGSAAPTTCVGANFATGNASANEGGNLSFAVTKNGTTSNTCTVNYATANGTAVAGANYGSRSRTLSFASGATSQAVMVATAGYAVRKNGTSCTALGASPITGTVG